MNLGEIAPTIDALLALEANELGLRLLPLLNEHETRGGILSLRWLVGARFYDALSSAARYHRGPYPGREKEAQSAVVEAWAWLEGQGFLVPCLNENNMVHPDARALSRRATKLAENPQQALADRLLPEDNLHPTIREDVWSLFHRGRYDTAVFEAMKAVEVSVRTAARLPAKDIGAHLMRKAFDPKTGPLTDMDTEMSEREARAAMFWGAIGSYKNPHSHRRVDLDDPNEAAEIIMLANHLLRIVDARASAVRSALGDDD